MAAHTSSLIVVGNPLLDLIVTDGEPLLEKYNLKSNDAILAGPEHSPMYAVLNAFHIALLISVCFLVVTKMSLRITNQSLYLEGMPILPEPLPYVPPLRA